MGIDEPVKTPPEAWERHAGKASSSGAFVPARWLAASVLGPALAVILVVGMLRASGAKWGFVFADPADIHDYSVLTGFFGYVGILFLTGSAAVSVFAWALLRRADSPERGAAAALVLAGALSLVLAVDDLFLLHEGMLRDAFGVPEGLIFAVYGLVWLVIVGRIGRAVFSRRYAALWLSAALLCGMVLADAVERVIGTPGPLLLAEETAKLCGFVTWSAFWMAYAFAAARGLAGGR